MKLSDFDYTYPEELVAQHPLDQRDSSRMMVINQSRKSFIHSNILKLPQFLNEGDVFVLNESRVIPARLFGTRDTGAEIEVLLVNASDVKKNKFDVASKIWNCIAKKSKRLKENEIIKFGDTLYGKILSKKDQILTIEFSTQENILKEFEKYGVPPLPPYIKRKTKKDYSLSDKKRYQTVFAKEYGSVAAPTAGLHITDNILNSIKERGVRITTLSLHVSMDTFAPVREEDITNHTMHGEFFNVSEESANIINHAKANNKRIIAVGTTTVRALEAAASGPNEIRPTNDYTNIFIYPEYKFKIVDSILTNFHQPKSTLIMMVSAFAERDFILKMYDEAIHSRYRLFSYGDCMLIQ
ncbi:tRNA preQ1(34) S-adenosylmethionine ribosyltransferase-isomerase QueA [bacterium]|nr:tRNA preQ1(34) S-adenosylmethionine ribosyltransferase-isomerase QueA [bacterium]